MAGNRQIKKVSVFCASSGQAGLAYIRSARDLGHILAMKKISIIYGGGAVGLMGHLVDSALMHQGDIIGVIPKFMVDLEWAHPGVKNMIIVDTMHERKRRMLDGSDAVIALPGGSGTLEELLEAITLKRLGLYLNPIVLVNTDHFFDHLIAMFSRCVTDRFMDPRHLDMWSVASSPDDVLGLIKNAPEWNRDAIKYAAI